MLIILNKLTNPTLINLRAAFICFILCDTILVRTSVLIEWHWVCYQLAGLLSSFFRRLVKISRPPGHFGIFIANKEEGVSQLSLRILPKKKN